MAAFNKVILIGNIGTDLELKKTPNDVSVTSFPIAVERRYTGKEQEKQTDWITVVAWRNTADFICKYFEKGKPILIVGALQTRTWTDQQGQKRYTTEVVADEAQFVGSKNDSANSSNLQNNDTFGLPKQSQAPYSPSANGTKFEEQTADDDLPF